MCGAVYCVPCLSCPQKYIGETGRKLETRIKEHQEECEKVMTKRKTRSVAQEKDTSKLQSAISENARENNHIMNCNEVSILERETDKRTRWIQEAIQVRELDRDVAGCVRGEGLRGDIAYSIKRG